MASCIIYVVHVGSDPQPFPIPEEDFEQWQYGACIDFGGEGNPGRVKVSSAVCFGEQCWEIMFQDLRL